MEILLVCVIAGIVIANIVLVIGVMEKAGI